VSLRWTKESFQIIIRKNMRKFARIRRHLAEEADSNPCKPSPKFFQWRNGAASYIEWLYLKHL
jgi:hypothetical protein